MTRYFGSCDIKQYNDVLELKKKKQDNQLSGAHTIISSWNQSALSPSVVLIHFVSVWVI